MRGWNLRQLGAVALRFGNCNNGAIDGLRALNVNNTAANANWNIGAAFIYLNGTSTKMQIPFLHLWRLRYRLSAIIGY